jgi:putative aldouronate transport system permease protein
MTSDNKQIQWIAHAALIAFSIACVVPFLLLVMSSVSSEQTILKHGYSFFPKEFSLSAYHYLWYNWQSLGRAYGITVLITIVGTSVSLAMTSMFAYPISRRDLPWRNFWTFFVFFTLLFNGGLVPAYLIYTKLFVIKNTIWALIVPGLLMNGFNVLLVRTFFVTSVPPALIEAANIDGCGEIKAFYKIVLPLSLPIMATIGLMQSILYWNDWFNGMTYVTDSKLFSIQNILNRMMTEIQFLSSDPNMSTSASETIAQLPSATVRMAIAVVGVLPILVAYPFFQKYFVKGITIGAVK